MTTHYYRVTKPEAIAAWAEYKAAAQAVIEAGKRFAALFAGARPVCTTGLHGRKFSGLAFNPHMPTDIWTVPDPKCGGIQRPRKDLRKVRGDRDARRAEHAKIVAIYAENEPKAEASSDAFYESLGTNWGDVMWSGFHIFECTDALYIAAGTSIDGEEITASAYTAGRLAAA